MCRYICRLILFLYVLPTSAFADKQIDNIAFFYAKNPPVNELTAFDHVVVEDAALTDKDRRLLLSGTRTVYAYVSLGEYESWRKPDEVLPDGLIKTKNKQWNSSVVDVSHPYWLSYIMQQRVAHLLAQGYNGIFLDTLDSYQLFAKKKKQKRAMQLALINIVKKIRSQYPHVKILVNRGFEIIDEIAPSINGVVAESVFQTWDDVNKKYRKVRASDTKYLLKKLQTIQNKHRLPVVVIDYVAVRNRDLAIDTANKIVEHGFTPWVSVPSLDYLGISTQRVEPRKLLMLYNSEDYDGGVDEQPIFKFLGVVADYYGYSADYHDLKQGLPKSNLAGEYAGVVTWFLGGNQVNAYKNWFLQQVDQNIRFAVLGYLGFDLDLYLSRTLYLKSLGSVSHKGLKLQKSDDYVGFEYSGLLPKRKFSAYRIEKCRSCESHLQFKSRESGVIDTVITAPWGGWVQNDWVLDYMPSEQHRWIVEPFKFLNTALQLDRLPAPDVTTQYGRRILLTHIDGDGFLNLAQMPGTPYSASVIIDKVLKKYKIPHTVSVIEGEVGAAGLYPDKHRELEKIARHMFTLPHIEPASHTYSHPFFWGKVKQHDPKGKHYHLPLEHYDFDFERDIKGSIEYVNTLLPKGKEAKVLLWSGDALPTEEALAVVEKYNYYNLNGGNTVIRNDRNSFTYVTPMSRKVGPYTQIYAPIMNENVYTNDWLGPFYGFRDVIQTLEKTNKPRRLKPMNIYYHFYSGEKFSALNALLEVYDWAVGQEYSGLYISDYVKKVNEFERIVYLRNLQDDLIVKHAKEIRSFRDSKRKNTPLLGEETGVIGFRDLHDGRYIHTDGSHPVVFRDNHKKLKKPSLIQTNAQVFDWQYTGKGVNFSLIGNENITVDIKEDRSCRMKSNVQFRKRKLKNKINRYKFYAKNTGLVSLKCR